MWIVRLALERPYTFVVLSLMLLLLAPVVVTRTPTDIFPNIDIPVVSVIWQYTGLSALGWNGTCASWPHSEHVAVNISRDARRAPPPPPPPPPP